MHFFFVCLFVRFIQFDSDIFCLFGKLWKRKKYLFFFLSLNSSAIIIECVISVRKKKYQQQFIKNYNRNILTQLIHVLWSIRIDLLILIWLYECNAVGKVLLTVYLPFHRNVWLLIKPLSSVVHSFIFFFYFTIKCNIVHLKLYTHIYRYICIVHNVQ